jgi:thiamine kinase-like enzyme
LDSCKNKDIKQILVELLAPRNSGKLLTLDKLAGGANSIVYKISTDHHKQYLVKKYILRKGDNRDRLSTEFFGLSFLWNNGVRNIPEPIIQNKEYRIGIYRFVEGRKLNPGEIELDDIYTASDFLRQLHALVNVENADKQPIASEACFSINAYIDCVEGRLGNLKNIPAGSDIHEMLHIYLRDEFIPFFTEAKQFVAAKADQLNINLNERLPKNEKTLSPSDFGFHNVIKSVDGPLYFIDFEYYGWDDPAKMIGDFYLQPAVPVPSIYRETFLKNICGYLEKNTKLEKRLSLVYLLLALKWCLIMLNVYIHFSYSKECDEATCIRQLEKAKDKLKEIKHEFGIKSFPFSLG